MSAFALSNLFKRGGYAPQSPTTPPFLPPQDAPTFDPDSGDPAGSIPPMRITGGPPQAPPSVATSQLPPQAPIPDDYAADDINGPPQPMKIGSPPESPSIGPQGPPPTPDAGAASAIPPQPSTGQAPPTPPRPLLRNAVSSPPPAPSTQQGPPTPPQVSDDAERILQRRAEHPPGKLRTVLGVAAGMYNPGIGQAILHPDQPALNAALQRRQLDVQREQLARQREKEQAETKMYAQHGQYWENKGEQEKYKFKVDPKTGRVFNMDTGQFLDPPKELKDKVAELKAANPHLSDDEAFYYAMGGKPEPKKQHVVAPGGTLVGEDGKPLYQSPAAEKPITNEFEAYLKKHNGDAAAATADYDTSMARRARSGRASVTVAPAALTQAQRDAANTSGKQDPESAQEGPPVNERFLATLPLEEQATLKAISEGRRFLPKGNVLKDPYWKAISQHLDIYNPGYKEQTAGVLGSLEKDFSSGPSSKNIRSLNTLSGHLGTLHDMSVALNSKDMQSYNRLANFLSKQFGDPSVTNFEMAKAAVSTELSSALKGQATEGDIKTWADAIRGAASPRQIEGAATTPLKLMRSRLHAFEQQYEASEQKKPRPGLVVYPETQKTFDRFGVNLGGGDSGTVNMKAPNGKVKSVPANEVEHYKKLGAVVVQ